MTASNAPTDNPTDKDQTSDVIFLRRSQTSDFGKSRHERILMILLLYSNLDLN